MLFPGFVTKEQDKGHGNGSTYNREHLKSTLYLHCYIKVNTLADIKQMFEPYYFHITIVTIWATA